MRKSSLIIGLLHGIGLGHAQNLTTPSATPSPIFVNSKAPTGTPVAGDYNGRYRPQVHFSPPKHFMNDPNGMFKDANDTWHLYYQVSCDYHAGDAI